ncbi:MAG TPA: 3-hydroxyacyl-CoA dehydrogenase NAD-binding domain-containing protein [Luteitalea sp.]|nr:3-hydroxyacyl-CoA dehydrogenase NAD-binding domain-containing protein [Luteitalea sp.]
MRPDEFQRIGVVGTGLIGASWAAYFLSRGFDVQATDPAPEAEAALRRDVERMWTALTRIGLAPGASLDRLSFHADLETVLTDVDFVQESGPERLPLKRALMARIADCVGEDVLIATSSSGLLISEIQEGATHPERFVLGHPFNPPHLLPLVEVVGGRQTSHATVDAAMTFYAAIGKKPIRLQREIRGHIANRLQAALWREAISLVEQGVATAADVDTAIAHGPGLRWALLGPFANLHLSGGPGGIGHTIDHLGPAIEDWWRDLGSPSLDARVRTSVVDGVSNALARTDHAAMVAQRDALLLALLEMKRSAPALP